MPVEQKNRLVRPKPHPAWAVVTHSSHLKDHLNEYEPVYFSSTAQVGLHNSIVFTLLAAVGADAVANSDAVVGSNDRKLFSDHVNT